MYLLYPSFIHIINRILTDLIILWLKDLLIKTGNKKTETTPWYVTLRTSYWYDNDDYDVTTRSRLATLSWYTSEIESDNDLDYILDEWSITTRTTTTTTTKLL